ncbi:hypothetical protein KEM55_009302, partial [Ascosphaera atra]
PLDSTRPCLRYPQVPPHIHPCPAYCCNHAKGREDSKGLGLEYREEAAAGSCRGDGQGSGEEGDEEL